MKYTNDEILKVAKGCSTRLEFTRKHKNMCEAARHRGLLVEIYQWLPESDQRYTPEEILETVKTCRTRTEWQRKYSGQYRAANRLGIMDKIRDLVPDAPNNVAAYSEAELVEIAKNFTTRPEWEAYGKQEMEQGKVSSYYCALSLGPEFFRCRCSHLEQHHRWTDAELLESAQLYQHKSDWKKGDNAAYQTAVKNSKLFKQATAHMTTKANPYAGDYIVYAYEFKDRHVYVGLTFRPQARHAQHMCRGPVFEHLKTCLEHAYKVLEHGVGSPDAVAALEKAAIQRYRDEEWTLLNISDGGGLGTLSREWNKELILEQAFKFATKQEWIDNSQMSYRIAKREGWFDEASAHMPKRVLGVGAGVAKTPEAREKMRQAKLGTRHTPEMKAARSAATRKWWAGRKASTTAESVV